MGALYGFPNRADAGTLSGGSWTAGLPLANLQSSRLRTVARSSSATLANTQFDVDLGTDLYLRVVHIPGRYSNLSLDAQYRVRIGNDASFAASNFDSGWTDVYGVIYPSGVLNFGDPGFFDGKLASVDWTAGERLPVTCIVDPISTGRYVRVEIDDTTNADGYVELPRLWISYAYEPEIGVSVGAGLGWQDSTTFQELKGGARIGKARTPRKVFNVSHSLIANDEALVRWFDTAGSLGTTGEMFFAFDADDTEHMHRRSMICQAETLDPLRFPNWGFTEQAWTLTEVL